MISSTDIARVLTVVAIAVGHLYFFPYFKHLGNPNENVRVYMVKAIVEHGTFALNEVIAREGPVDDRALNRGHRCTVGGRVEPCTYAAKAPGTSYAGVPVYWALRSAYALAGSEPDLTEAIYFLRLFCVIVPSLWFLWRFYLFLGRHVRGEHERLLTIAVLGLGSMSFTYAHLFAGHQLVAVATFGSFLLVERARERARRWPLFAAGFLAFFAGTTEYPAVFATAALYVYAVLRLRGRRWQALLLFGAGGVAPSFLVLLYHAVCFDSPWRTPYSMLANPAYAGFHSVGIVGIRWPSAEAAYESLISPARGLFFFAPFLLLALPGLVLLWRRGHRAELGLCAFIVLMYLVYQSSVNPDIGGWSIGPRYIVLVTPFLAFASAIAVDELGRRSDLAVALVATPLALLSVLFTFVSTVVYHTFPPAFTNPFFEWVVPLWRLDFFQYSLGTLAGLRGLASSLPGILPVGAMAAALTWGPPGPAARRLALAGSALLVASAIATGLSHLGRFESADKSWEFERLTRMWEPRPVAEDRLRDAERRVEQAPTDVAALEELAMLRSRLGDRGEALRRFRQAARAAGR